MSQCQALEAAVQGEEDDKAALLEYVQEMEDDRQRYRSLLAGNLEEPGASEDKVAGGRNGERGEVKAGNDAGRCHGQESFSGANGPSPRMQSMQASMNAMRRKLTAANESLQRMTEDKDRAQEEARLAREDRAALEQTCDERQQLLVRVQRELVESDKRLKLAERGAEAARKAEQEIERFRQREATLLKLDEDLRADGVHLKQMLQLKESRLQEVESSLEHLISCVRNGVRSLTNRHAADDDVSVLAMLSNSEPMPHAADRISKELHAANETRHQLEDMRSQRDVVAGRLEDLAREHQALQSSHADSIAAREKLSSRVDDLLSELEDFRVIRCEQEDLMVELEGLRALIQQTQSEFHACQAERDRLVHEAATQAGQLRSEQEERGHAVAARDCLAEKVAALERRLQEEGDERQRAAAGRDRERARAKELQGKVEGLQ
ncbi:unnamed protein product, partial [Ostreobium quekettii]